MKQTEKSRINELIDEKIHPITGYKYDQQRANKKPRNATRRFSEHYY